MIQYTPTVRFSAWANSLIAYGEYNDDVLQVAQQLGETVVTWDFEYVYHISHFLPSSLPNLILKINISYYSALVILSAPILTNSYPTTMP